MKLDWRDIAKKDWSIAIALGVLYTVWLLATARSLGFPRDEGFYFHAGSDYARWFELLVQRPGEAVQRGAIDAAWGNNHEHPALMKSLFGLSWLLFHERFHFFADASTAFRFPAMCMSGMAVSLTYMFGARAYSRRAGLVAACLLALMPRVFFHAHLACFDAPIMAMWLAVVYVYWRAEQKGGLLWALAVGVVYGLALDTKHNAWILPAVVVPHALVVHGRSIVRGLKVGRFPIPASLLSMAIIGPAVFYACWPWLWPDALPRLQEYVNFHLHHEYYNIEFLGRNYFGPPSPPSYAPVMILATVPTITILLFLIGLGDRARAAYARLRAGAGRWWKEDRVQTDLLLVLAFAAPLAVFFRPTTPIFGGTKHWMPAYPFLAILAGRGLDVVIAAMDRAQLPAWFEKRREALRIQMVALVIAAPFVVTIHSHPYGLSAYVPLVGGTAGGADLGLNRQFWGFTTESAAQAYLNANAPPHASVFIHDTAWDSWARMVEEKRVRPDLQASGSPGEAMYALVQHELHMNEVDYQIWVAYDSPAPVYVLRHDGVPIVSIYKRP